MTKAANDNEELSFITLAAATANVTRYLGLDEKKNEQSESEPNPDRRDEQKRESHSDYVAKRVRDIAAFERRIAGNKN
jgi:hypothetical protein